MRLNIFFIFILLTTPLQAQYTDLLNNPKITWVAEYTADFELNPIYSDNLEEQYNWIRVIRLENKQETRGLFSDMEVGRYFSQSLLHDLNAGLYACFADEALQQPISAAQLSGLLNPADTTPSFDHPLDTIITINPVTIEDIQMFRIGQVFYYEAGRQQFGSRLLAFAPLVNQHDQEGNFTGRRPLFWIKFPAPAGKTSKTEAAANYLLQTYPYDNAPRQDSFLVKKGKLDLQGWTANAMEYAKHPILDNNDFSLLDAGALHAAIFRTDTVVTFNDDGQAEIGRIIENNAILQVEKIRFVQNWAFDERRRTLACRIVAAAPLAAMRDSDGNFRYYKPLFYVQY